MAAKGFLQGWNRRGRVQQQRRKFLLRLARKPNDFELSDGFLRGLLSGSHYKIADRPALDFRSAADHGKRFTCDAGFQACGSSGSLRHGKSHQ